MQRRRSHRHRLSRACAGGRADKPAGEGSRAPVARLSEGPGFEFGLPLAPAGTHFQRRVWDRIAAIPAGQTRSYGEIAAAIHSGPRAVGNACGANPYPIVVPCHRVVAATSGTGRIRPRQRGGFLLDIKKLAVAA